MAFELEVTFDHYMDNKVLPPKSYFNPSGKQPFLAEIVKIEHGILNIIGSPTNPKKFMIVFDSNESMTKYMMEFI